MRDIVDVPEGDLFALIHEHRPGTFVYDAQDLGMPRSDDLAIVRITCDDTRTSAQKPALSARIAGRLSVDPGLRTADVFINLAEVKREKRSFGNGIGRYAQT